MMLLCAGSAGAAVRLDVDQTGLSLQEAAASQAIVHAVLERLPPAMQETLTDTVSLEWRADLPERVHGRAIGRRVVLDRSLLQVPSERLETRPGRQDLPPHPALAALIHELAHVHDRSLGRALSHDPRLLDIAGWQVSPARLGLRRPSNAFTDRSPDPYELERPSEFVAVNLEHFLLDPAYACRRPAMHRYLADHFGWSPPRAPCADGLVFLQSPGSVAAAAGDSPVLGIDPTRVYSVEYLLAEPNEQPMSRWGHVMLRLVICAPGRAPGPDCRLDLQHHQVLSFRAFVDDLQLSSWRGLTGSYPSRLFVLPLQQVVDEYTRVELRGLQSIPLELTVQEIAALIERAAQLHWNYDGRYAFISNNCAVETYRLLHDAVPRLTAMRLGSITPNGLLRRLRREGVADVTVLQDGSEALRVGYRFEAMSARYQSMFDVARERLGLPPMQVQDWLELPPAARGRWIDGADLRASAALLVLEQAALRRQELLARDELKRAFLGVGADETRARIPDAMERYLDLEGVLSRPALLLPQHGYGLPQQFERDALLVEATSRVAWMSEQGEWLRTQGRLALSNARRTNLQGTEENLDALGERLRVLNREQGGVPLH